MGALTINRKRGEDYLISQLPSSPPTIDPSYGHISKKPKLLESATEVAKEFIRTSSPKSIASRISQYPESKGFTRQVHAPVRNSKFGSFSYAKKSISEENSAEKMRRFNGFWILYENTKREAFRSLRYAWKEDKVSGKKEKKNEVILIDSEEENRDDATDYSYDDEEVETVGNEQRDVRSSRGQTVETVAREVRSLDTSVGMDVGSEYGMVIGDPHDLSLPLYKRLLDISMRREGILERLKNDIEIAELSARRFKSLRPQRKVELLKKDIAEECFTPLTRQEESEVSRAFSNSNWRKVLVMHKNSGIDITGEKLQCLRPGAWLNDEVINVYLELLKEREKREPKKFLKCHFFNTFFYKKLINGKGYNFQSVRRWTTQRKLGYSLLECDKIFVPIHKEIHWCLAIINKKDNKFQYLDSLNGVDSQVLNVLARYFADEVKDKCGKDIDVSSWEKEYVVDLPQQENGFDCGMFMVKYADFYSRDIGLCFGQEHMPYFRKRTAKEILKLRAE